MTDTKKPTTTVAQDVAALRAVLDGQHAQTESPAEVLAQKIVDAQPFTHDNDATRVWQLFKNEEMAVEFVALILREADRLSHALAAGKVAPDGYVLMPRKPTPEILAALYGPKFASFEDAYAEALEVGAPPADPAKGSGSAPVAWMLRCRKTGEVFWDETGCLWQNEPDAKQAAADMNAEIDDCDMEAFAVYATPPSSAPEVTDSRRPGFNETAHIATMTYTAQPNNVEAWRLGEACAKASPGGDFIDHGLSLLRELHLRGYGIVRINPLTAALQEGKSHG